MALKQQAKMGLSVAAQSFGLLGNHKWLALFPILSFFVTLALIAFVAFGLFEVAVSTNMLGQGTDALKSVTDSLDSAGPESEKIKLLSVAGVVALFALSVFTHFVFTFFNVALAACVLGLFEGKSIGVAGGVSVASRRIAGIFGWSCVVAVIGSITQAVEKRANFMTTALVFLAGFAWRMATFFVIPIIASKNVGPITAIKGSTQIMRDVWGQSVTANLGLRGIRLIFIAVIFGGVALTHVISGPQALIDVGVVAVPVIVIVALLLTTIGTITRTALFYYATKSEAPAQFDPDVLQNAIIQRRSRS